MTTIDDLKQSYLPFGEENSRFAEYFSGKSYLGVLTQGVGKVGGWLSDL